MSSGMATFNVEINNKPGKSGLHLLLLRITKDRKHKRIALSRYVKPKDFNKAAKFGSWIRNSNPQAKALNSLIKDRIQELSDIENEIEHKGDIPTITKIASSALSGNTKSFIDFARLEVERHKAKGQFRTAVKKGHLISKVLECNAQKDLGFADLTVTFLKKYESHWSEAGNKTNTLQTDFKGIRAIVKSAIEEGHLTKFDNPFEKFKIKYEKTERVKLTEAEITALENVVLKPGTNHQLARNMFLFAYYTAGMRFADVLQLKWKHIKGNRLMYVMDKTNNAHSVPLTAKPLEILKFYSKKKVNQEAFVFPLLDLDMDYSDSEFLLAQISSKNALINKYLRSVGEKAKIKTKFSFHISRHSFADHALRKTGNLHGVSKSLGHQDYETTQIYLKQTDNEAVDTIVNKMFAAHLK